MNFKYYDIISTLICGVVLLFVVSIVINWDISKVTNIEGMFASAGYNATPWNRGDLSNWDTSNVTRMRTVFMNAGRNATYLLDCSNWTVDKVTNHDYFNYGVSSKVKAPTWK